MTDAVTDGASPFASDPLREQLQTSLGDAYALERELGGGGMSRVFVAWEPALGRRVVVKMLAPELAQGLSVERFAREIRLAAALQHPHVVPVLTAGSTTDGLPYYTMPFVEGESLRARLLAGAVPFGEAVGILRDVARALEYAHAHGVVHRDIKPENVLLAGRTAAVADFGIAKAVSAARTLAPGGTLTSVGQSLGTPAYMAPEQGAGDVTDHRADLYAWGVMAYELLAGRHPFADKGSAAQLIAAHIAEAPKPLSDAKPGAPPPIAALVMRCLAKDPEARPHDAGELLAALDAVGSGDATGATTSPPPRRRARALAIGVTLVGLAALGAWGILTAMRDGAASDAAGAKSIAVLPFEHQGDTADRYLTEGITDEIRGKLTGVSDLVVIARSSSTAYRGTTKSPTAIAEELGVHYLLGGTVRVVGTGDARRVVLRPELVEITSAGQPQSRWQAPFDGPATDVVQVQGEIARQVVGAMASALGSAAQAQLTRAPSADPAAYDLYLRAQAAWNSGASADPASLERAIELLQQAVARDPRFVQAWSELARTASLLYSNARPLSQTAQLARRAVEQLAVLAPDGVEAHRARSTYLRIVEDDAAGAYEAMQRARRAAPNDALVLANIALLEGELGRLDESLQTYDAALRLDPRASTTHSPRVRVLLRLRRIADARAAAERARALAPTSLSTFWSRLAVELAAGDLMAARRVIDDAARDIPRDRISADLGNAFDLGWVLEEEDARRVLDAGPDAFGGHAVTMAVVRAQMYWWRGDAARARVWADSAVAGLREELRESPHNAESHLFLALMLAHGGQGTAAIAEAERGLAIANERPDKRQSIANAYHHYVAARVAAVAGDRERALAWLRESLARRYYATPAWVRLDPSWKPLRGDARFEQLLADAR